MQWISNLDTKNFNITSFLICSIFISIVFFSQNSSAQDLERSDGSTVVTPMVIEVLWDQSDNPSGTDIVSQDFIDGAPFDIFDARAADDFLVPDGYVWEIESVKVFGTYDGAAPNNIQSLDVVFYEDQGGLPGEIVDSCNFINIQPVDLNDPSFLISLPTPCVLRPGTYWMSVRANMLFLPNGQWFWNERTVQTLNPFVWENPGNGFGTGCTTYSYAVDECGTEFPDLTFQLMGDEVPFPSVPALGTLGLAILTIALGLIGIISYRKVRIQQALKR